MSETQNSPRPVRNFANFTQYLKKVHFPTAEEYEKWLSDNNAESDTTAFKASDEYIKLKEAYSNAAKAKDLEIKQWDERHPEQAKAIHKEHLAKKKAMRLKKDKRNMRQFRGLPVFVVKELNKYTGLMEEAYDEAFNEISEARKRVRVLETELADALERGWEKAVSSD